MSKVRVLVVDDAVVVRRLVGDVLAEDPDLEVAGTAANGKIALARVPQLNPDLVTLDVEMPELDGLGTLAVLRKEYPRLPVIMFSTLTQRGAAATLDALALGARDYVTKPANVGSVAAAKQAVRDQLIPKIKALCGRGPVIHRRALTPPATSLVSPSTPKPVVPFRRSGGGIELVVIGVSTGGPNALAQVLPALPGDLGVPVLIVQHMPPVFTRLLADRLNSQCRFPVREAAGGERPSGSGVWLAPGGKHLEVGRDPLGLTLRVNEDPPENSCRPAVDVLFRTATTAFGGGVLGVVLTGMGQDGLRGAERIKEAGGQVLAQDEATSVVWGMPGYVAEAGLADRVLPLPQIAAEIARRVRVARPAAIH